MKIKEVVVVTGASAGVGRAIAHAFAKRGARLGLVARGINGLEACKREVESLGGEAIVLPADVAESEKVFSVAARVEEKWGPIDIWVNNAMVSVFSPVKKMHAEEFKRVTDVTYLGYVYGTQAALRSMLPRNQGKILQIGSALAMRSIPLQSAYCGAKHAIHGFTESLRSELLHDHSGVTITELELPAVNTPQFRWVRSRLAHKPQPVPPIFQPELIGEAAFWAAHSKRRDVAIGFPSWRAIIAEKFIPGLIDRYLARTNYQAQQTMEKTEIPREDNLISPLPGKASTHGDFDYRARRYSLWFWLNKNRSTLLALSSLGALAYFLRPSRQTSRGQNKSEKKKEIESRVA